MGGHEAATAPLVARGADEVMAVEALALERHEEIAWRERAGDHTREEHVQGPHADRASFTARGHRHPGLLAPPSLSRHEARPWRLPHRRTACARRLALICP
jgi:hypothetical protein